VRVPAAVALRLLAEVGAPYRVHVAQRVFTDAACVWAGSDTPADLVITPATGPPSVPAPTVHAGGPNQVASAAGLIFVAILRYRNESGIWSSFGVADLIDGRVV
jgi:hypothetical protein